MHDRPYRIEVEGELGDRYAHAFDGMALSREPGTTVLEGIVRDQAHLDGLLRRLSVLGVALISVEPQDP